jgi:ABC-type branched-subunit amino acid transport system substrate-binding protein
MLLSANLLWLLGSGEALSTTGSNVIKLGCSLGYIADDPTLVDYIQAVHLRVKQLNEQNSTLIDSNAKIELVYENHEFDSTKTIQKAISIMNSGVIAAVGAGYSSRTILSSLIWQTVKIPQCDAYASNPSLSNKAAYPNFFRTYPTDKSFADAMLGWILDQGWTKVAIAYTNEDYGNGFATLFTGLARTANLTVLTQQSIELKGTSAKAKDAAYQIKDSGAKIVLYFGYLNEFETLVKEAKALGIWGPGYAWIGTDGLSGVPSAYSGKTDLDGLIYFFPRERANNAAAASFDAYWTANRFSTTNPYANSSALAPGALAYFGATCVDLLMLGLDKLLKSDATYTLSGLVNGTYNEKLKIPDSFRFPTYQSPSGTIISDANGDR